MRNEILRTIRFQLKYRFKSISVTIGKYNSQATKLAPLANMAENSHVVASSRSAHRLDDPCKIRTADVLNADNDKRQFSDLHFPEKISTGLASAGFLRPSPVQWAALPLAKIGVDLIVQSKSGTGKTLVYVVTALNMIDTSVSAVQAVILTPTREIAVQGARISLDIAAASMPDFKAATLIGGMSVVDDATKLKRCHMIVGTPGRVRQLIDEKYFKTEAVRFFALDEADKMLESSFKNDVTWIYNQLPEVKQVMALSATYPDSLANSLTSLMRHPQHVRLDTASQVLIGLDQYVLHTTFHPKPKYQLDIKFSALLDVLNSLTFSQCLIFTNYSLSAQSICERLNGNGWPAIYIAATLQNQYERLQALNSLRQFTTRIMVTTDLSARGVDAANVTLVINFDIPWDSRTFLHRSGRAGRFGSRGINLSLASEGDEADMLRKIVFRTGTKIKTIPYQTDSQTDEKGDNDSKVNEYELPDLWKSDKDQIKLIIEKYHVLEGLECPLEEFNVDKQKNEKIVDKDETKENEQPKKKKRGNRKKKNKDQDAKPHSHPSSTKTLKGDTAQFEVEGDNLDHNQNSQYGRPNGHFLDENEAYYDDTNYDYYDYEDEEYYEYDGEYDDYYDENEYFDENYATNDEYSIEPEIGAWQNVLGVHGLSKDSEMCENKYEDDYEGEAENFIIDHYKQATGYEPPLSKYNSNHSSKDNLEEYEKAKNMMAEYFKVKLAKKSDERFQKMLSYKDMQLLADQIVTGKDISNHAIVNQKSIQNTEKGITFSTDSLVAAVNTIKEYDDNQWMHRVKSEAKKLKAGDAIKSDVGEQPSSKARTEPHSKYISTPNSESSFEKAKNVLSEEIKFSEQNYDHVSSFSNDEPPSTSLTGLFSEKEKPIKKSDRSIVQTDVKDRITGNKAKSNTNSSKLGPDGLPMWTPVESKDDDIVAGIPNCDDNLEVFQKGNTFVFRGPDSLPIFYLAVYEISFIKFYLYSIY